jgi:glycerol-3-phosphate dehydrogenase
MKFSIIGSGEIGTALARACQLSCIDRSNPAWVCSSRTRAAR